MYNKKEKKRMFLKRELIDYDGEGWESSEGERNH